jgi:hypothetical protein
VKLKGALKKRYGYKMHYPRDGGSKAHSKRGMVIKCTTQEMVAQRRTWKEVGLENALPEK